MLDDESTSVKNKVGWGGYQLAHCWGGGVSSKGDNGGKERGGRNVCCLGIYV